MGTPVAFKYAEKFPMYTGGGSLGWPQLSIYNTDACGARKEIVAPRPPLHLNEVDVVRCEPVGVLLVVAAAARAVELARALACARVESEAQATVVRIRHEAVHPRWETLRVHLEVAIRVALPRRPAVVEEQRRVVQLPHASRDESVSNLVELLLEAEVEQAAVIVSATRADVLNVR